QSLGFVVQAVGDGHEALRRLEAIRPDLILTDLVMPRVNGLQLVQSVRADPAVGDIPVVAMSASASDYTRAEAIAVGCADFLTKPLKLAGLPETLGNQLGLQWRLRSSAATAGVESGCSAAAPPFQLPPELAGQLLDLAMQGDVMAITALIDSTLAHDSAASSF